MRYWSALDDRRINFTMAARSGGVGSEPVPNVGPTLVGSADDHLFLKLVDQFDRGQLSSVDSGEYRPFQLRESDTAHWVRRQYLNVSRGRT